MQREEQEDGGKGDEEKDGKERPSLGLHSTELTSIYTLITDSTTDNRRDLGSKAAT